MMRFKAKIGNQVFTTSDGTAIKSVSKVFDVPEKYAREFASAGFISLDPVQVQSKAADVTPHDVTPEAVEVSEEKETKKKGKRGR